MEEMHQNSQALHEPHSLHAYKVCKPLFDWHSGTRNLNSHP